MRFSTVVVRNLQRRKLRSLLSTLSVAACVASTIALVGFSAGFERSMTEVYTTRHIDLVVSRAGVTQRLTSNLDQDLGKRLREVPGVREVAPSQTDIVSFGEGNLVGIPVLGWLPGSVQMNSLVLTKGDPLAAADHDQVLIGEQLATTLEKSVGDEVEIELRKFRIRGIFAGMNVYENMTAVVLLPDLQRLMDREGQVTEFQLVLTEAARATPAAVGRVRAAITALRDEQGKSLGLAATPAREFVESSTEAGLTRGMAWGTSAVALLIGVFGMLNTMFMSVFERYQEIGVLKALGWPDRRVVRLIVTESLLLSLVGAAVGAVWGLGATWTLARVPWVSGMVRSDVSPWVLAAGVGLALVIGICGSSYPAWRAARLAPTEALRYE